MSSISADVRPYAKEILLALCFLSALPAIVNRAADIVGAVPHAGYLVLLIILWGGLLGAAYTSPAFLRWTTAVLLAGQFGRASCRERVCQSVSFSGVAVYLKK